MWCHAEQACRLDGLLPGSLIALEIIIPSIGWENIFGLVIPLDRPQNCKGRGTNRTYILAGLGIAEAKASYLEIDLDPFQAGNLFAPTSRQHPQPHDVERLAIDALGLQVPQCLTEGLHLIEGEVAVPLIVGLSNGGDIAWITRDKFAAPCEAEDGG
jgi:hypothetical protein